jgi:hypothetical protein
MKEITVRLLGLNAPNPYNSVIYTTEEVQKAIDACSLDKLIGCLFVSETEYSSNASVHNLIDITAAALFVPELIIRGDSLFAKIQILDTPRGKLLEQLLTRVRFSVSNICNVVDVDGVKFAKELKIVTVSAIAVTVEPYINIIGLCLCISEYMDKGYNIILHDDKLHFTMSDDMANLSGQSDYIIQVESNVMNFIKCRAPIYELREHLYANGLGWSTSYLISGDMR